MSWGSPWCLGTVGCPQKPCEGRAGAGVSPGRGGGGRDGVPPRDRDVIPVALAPPAGTGRACPREPRRDGGRRPPPPPSVSSADR